MHKIINRLKNDQPDFMPIMKLRLSFILFVILGMAGCATPPAPVPQEEITFIEEIIEPAFDINAFIKERLLAQYDEWKGTPYKYDSISSKGIDCSGFMYVTFKSQFGIEMPRSTDMQVKLGEPVSKSDLRIGDLVFFKTSTRNRHVGVYLGDSQFMHASTRDGVKISSLDNSYWKKAYWTSKRIFS